MICGSRHSLAVFNCQGGHSVRFLTSGRKYIKIISFIQLTKWNELYLERLYCIQKLYVRYKKCIVNIFAILKSHHLFVGSWMGNMHVCVLCGLWFISEFIEYKLNAMWRLILFTKLLMQQIYFSLKTFVYWCISIKLFSLLLLLLLLMMMMMCSDTN